jgi:hypothetical protein
MGAGRGDVLKMRGRAAYEAPKAHNGVDARAFRKTLCGNRNFERAGDPEKRDVVVGNARLAERLLSAFQ